MNQRRPFDLLHVLQSIDQILEIMPIDGTHILKPQRFEKKPRSHESEKRILEFARRLVEVFSHLGERAQKSHEVFLQPERQFGGQLFTQK
jgi:hypothetical protein